ncbi:MAG TPA: hypothetical protein VKG45_13355 [Actinomycetes bacterium]|nr:hypothetical protein [Actinomycetes bacterium]
MSERSRPPRPEGGDRGRRSGGSARPRQEGPRAGQGAAGRRGATDRSRAEAVGAGEEEPLPVAEVLPPEVLDELRETVRAEQVRSVQQALARAVVALADEDPESAVRSAREAKRLAPRSAAVREALGLGLYQSGAYREARTELAAAQRFSGTHDLSAVLADIERGLGRPERAVELFESVDRSGIGQDAAAELLLVAAAAYGDLGRPAAGAALIRRHGEWPAQLREHHLRLAYVQGTLAQQAGDAAGARKAFERVVAADPEFHDAAERLDQLTRGNPADPA